MGGEQGYNQTIFIVTERLVMDRFVTYLAEKFIDTTYSSLRGLFTPNPFRRPDPSAWWLTACPEDFFAIPEAPPQLNQTIFRLGALGTLSRFTFPSSYQSPHPQNNTVHGVADLRPSGDARAALIFVHGHKMASFLPLELFARRVIRNEFDVYYLALPYHMRRAPKGAWSGQHSLNADIEGTAMAFMQGVRDVRALISWIEQERGIPVALAGVSLGAFTCNMVSVVDPRPKAVVSLLGGGSLAQIHWDGYQMGQIRRQLQTGGVTFEQLEQYWSLLSPQNWQSRLPREKLLLVGGQYDPIVTPDNVRKLWRAWKEPQLLWFPCGHVTASLYYRSIGQAMQTFLQQALKPS